VTRAAAPPLPATAPVVDLRRLGARAELRGRPVEAGAWTFVPSAPPPFDAVEPVRGADGVPFVPLPPGFDPRGAPIALPGGRYDWIHVAALAEPGLETTVTLYYRSGVDPEWLRFPARAALGGPLRARIAVPRREELLGVRFAEGSPPLVWLTLAALRRGVAGAAS
jgi:hypothetical protein